MQADLNWDALHAQQAGHHRGLMMLDFFRLFKDGKRYRRLREGFQRIFAATIFFGTSDQPEGKLLLDWARFHSLTPLASSRRTGDCCVVKRSKPHRSQ